MADKDFRPVHLFEVCIPEHDPLGRGGHTGTITIVANELGQQMVCTRSYDGSVSTNEPIYSYMVSPVPDKDLKRVEVVLEEGTRVYETARERPITEGTKKIVQIAAAAHVDPRARSGLKREG